jgi:hypothetical protein
MAGYFGVDMVKEGTPYTKEDIIGASVLREGVAQRVLGRVPREVANVELGH